MHRIVWLYKRWQPLYTAIQRTVMPRVEFIRGIPPDLHDDDFFDPRMNNLLVLDDLFSEAGKDKRITDLFTEGSHHRSLSVISINQNLFGNKDPTQRRNCHYLVLFNNPVDKQSLMTLARQMYPGNTDKFMTAFTKATKQPYGHLTVDLKPFTPEDKRLIVGNTLSDNRTPLSTNENGALHGHVSLETIKHAVSGPDSHISVGIQTGDIADHTEEISDTMDKNACDDCGQLFDTVHDVQRHVKNGWCPENDKPMKRKIDENDEEEPKAKWMKLDGDSDNDGFEKLWNKAKARGENKYNVLYNRYVSEGETPHDAKRMATERMESYDRRHFHELYTELLESYLFPLRTNDLHRRIVAKIDVLRTEGISLTTAIKRVLRKYKRDLNDVFEDFSDDDSSDTEDSEDGSDTTEDDDE